MDRLRTHFITQVRKGKIPSTPDLERYAKKNKLKIPKKKLRTVRSSWTPTAVRRNWERPTHFQTTQIPRIGSIQIDHASFRPQHMQWNGGCTGFGVAVCVETGLLECVPMNDRKMNRFFELVDIICQGDRFSRVTLISSDRESAVASHRFRKRVKKKYGVRLQYLSRNSKAFAAERAIRTVKFHLETVLESHEGDRDHLEKYR